MIVTSVEWGLNDYLSLVGLGLGISASVYLFLDWLFHKRKQFHVLLWSLAIICFYIFLTPFILVEFGVGITLPDWLTFLTNTVPLIFVGWVFVYWGIVKTSADITREKIRHLKSILVLWSILAFVFYAVRFSMTQYARGLSVMGIAIFFLAIHFMILRTTYKLFTISRGIRQKMRMAWGTGLIAAATLISTYRYFVVMNDLANLPKELWFISISSFDNNFALRGLIVVFLATGFVLIQNSARSSN